MAASRAASEDPTKIEVLRDALYQAVVENGSESRLWNQKELLALGVIPEQNLVMLMKVIQGLCQDFLFKAMNDARFGLCWRYRPPVDASKYKQLNQDQIMVYELIDDAGADGIWARNLKHRLNMHESVLKQCLKHLETKGFIRSMKSVENIGKKMYIKATLRPSERATGGPWYTDDTFDEAFIDLLQRIVFDSIRNRSSYLSRHGGSSSSSAANTTAGTQARQPKKGVVRGSAVEAAAGTAARKAAPRGTKRSADALSAGDDDHAPSNGPSSAANGSTASAGQPRRGRRHHEVRLPMPAGYTEYPTVRQIAELIEQAGITTNTTLGESDIQQLVDVLVYDGMLEPVRLPNSRDMGYRALNASRLGTGSSLQSEEDGGSAIAPGQTQPPMGAPAIHNGFTESPCGLCPVFDLCEDGGPVSPANCEYFNRWLGIEDVQATPPPLAQAGAEVDV